MSGHLHQSDALPEIESKTNMTRVRHIEEASRYLKDEDPHRAALEDNPEHAPELTWSTCFAVLFLALGYVGPIGCAVALLSSILVQIGTDLGDTSIIVWILGGGAVTSSVSLTVAGKASDIFGRRWTVLSGQLICIIAFIVGATAQKTSDIVVAGAINGFGQGFIFTSYPGISEMLPNKWRAFGLGFTETCMSVPWVGGNVIIATLLESRTAAGWRWIYYIALIYSGISMIGNFLFYFPPSRPQQDYEKTRWEELKEQDYVGILLYGGGLTAFLIGLTWGGSEEHPWKSVSTLAPLIIGGLGFLASFAYDFCFAENPAFPWMLCSQWRNYSILLVVVFVAGSAYFSMLALLPQATLYMFSQDPIEIGIIQLPSGLGQMFFGGFASLFIGKIGHLKAQIIIALVVQTCFLAVYSTVIPNAKTAWMALQFFGMGIFLIITILCYLVAGLNVSIKHLGLASGLIGTFRSMGGSVGNAIFNTILNNQVSTQLPLRIGKVAVANGLDPSLIPALVSATTQNALGVPGAFKLVPGITPAVEAALSEAFKEAYAYSFRRVFWATIPFGVVAVVCALFITDPSKYLTNHVAVPMEREGILGRSRGADHSDNAEKTQRS